MNLGVLTGLTSNNADGGFGEFLKYYKVGIFSILKSRYTS